MNSLQPIDGQIVVDGVMVVGTHAGCGKTIAATGLAATMAQDGLRMQAIKPLEFAAPGDLKRTLDQDFMNRILRPMQIPETLAFESLYELSNVEWNRLLHNCRSMTYSCLIETPGCYSSPLYFKDGTVRDAVDLAHDLNMPMLLVTSNSPEFLQTMRGAIEYLNARSARLVGWILVETRQAVRMPNWERECQYVKQHYELPYLGTIGYSPSVSVTSGHQGNLIHQTQTGIDLLPIQMASGTLVP